MAKPNRTLHQNKPLTPAKVRRQKDKIAEQKTQQMADAAYRRAYRHAQVTLARQQAKRQAMADAGLKPQQQQQPPAAPQQKKKPLAKAPKSGRKPQRR